MHDFLSLGDRSDPQAAVLPARSTTAAIAATMINLVIHIFIILF